VVTLRCSHNYFIYEKYKTIQSFKLYFLQNSPILQLYISTSDCKGVGNIPGSNFVKAFFQHFHYILSDICSITEVLSLPLLVPVEGTGKNQLELGQENVRVF